MLSKIALEKKEIYKVHYSKYGWVSIGELFEADFVESLCQILGKNLPWDLVTMVDGKPFIVSVEELKSKPQQFINNFINEVIQYAARHPFQYFYENLRLDEENHLFNEDLKPYVDLCANDEFVSYLKEITADESDSKIVETQITRYSAGSFLKEHTDHNNNPANQFQRYCAFVIGLTQSWSPDWGGTLHLDENDDGTYKSLTPKFNSINLFSVPRKHYVSQVSNFCPQARLSVTGWLAEEK